MTAQSELQQEKWMYEKFWSLLNDAQLMRVFEKYGPSAFRRSSVLEGFEQFIRAQNFSGHTVVEIGTLKGLTAVILSRYFERVVTIDIANDPLKYEIAEMLDIHNIAFVNVKNNEEKATVIEACQFDCAFVDGDHARDTFSDWDLVKRCNRVLFHEHWPAQPAVMELVSAASDYGNVATKDKWALWTK